MLDGFKGSGRRRGASPRRGKKKFWRNGPREAESETEEAEDLFPVPGEASDELGETARLFEIGERPDQVSECGHVPGSVSGPDGGAILPRDDISLPVKTVLDGPVVSDEVQKVAGRGFFRGVARDAVGDLDGGRSGGHSGDGASDAEGLADIGEGEIRPNIIGQRGIEDLDLPDLEAAMPLPDGSGRVTRRGKKPRCRGRREPPGVPAGCP